MRRGSGRLTRTRLEEVQGGLHEVRGLLELLVGPVSVHELRHGPLDLVGRDGDRIQLCSKTRGRRQHGLELLQLLLKLRDGLQLLLLLDSLGSYCFMCLSRGAGRVFKAYAGASESASCSVELLSEIVGLLRRREAGKACGP